MVEFRLTKPIRSVSATATGPSWKGPSSPALQNLPSTIAQRHETRRDYGEAANHRQFVGCIKKALLRPASQKSSCLSDLRRSKIKSKRCLHFNPVLGRQCKDAVVCFSPCSARCDLQVPVPVPARPQTRPRCRQQFVTRSTGKDAVLFGLDPNTRSTNFNQ